MAGILAVFLTASLHCCLHNPTPLTHTRCVDRLRRRTGLLPVMQSGCPRCRSEGKMADMSR